MSITTAGAMQPSTLPSKAAATKPTHPSCHRIRRGQKLDEVASLSEQRFASGADRSNTIAAQAPTASSSSSMLPSSSAASSTLSSAAPGPVASSSTSASGDSPFQLQEYLAMLVRRDPHNVEAITSLPTEADIESLTSSSKGKSKDDLAVEDDAIFQNVDTDVWVYEQLRRLVLDLTTPWLTSLQQECDKHLRPSTCAAMNAGDWMYLCASHGEEKQCCAIDYMVHTLDGATSLLNSARHFPSRTYVPNTSLRHFGSIARRLSRIFVHAWCYHKDLFLACEAETSLYSRFYVLVETYDLTATDGLPPRPGHSSTGSHDANASGAYGIDANEFSRATTTPAFTLNGTTAKRERSGTAASRSLLSRNLQQQQQQQQQTPTASSEVDAVGLVPPPAPSPRPTAILSRPEHEEGDAASDAPSAWSALARDNAEGSSFLSTDVDQDEDEDEEDEEEEGDNSVERTQKIPHAIKDIDEDATISLRAADPHVGLTGANGATEELGRSERGYGVEKEESGAAPSAQQPPASSKEDRKAGSVDKEEPSAATNPGL